MENKKYFSSISVDDTYNYNIQNSEKKDTINEKIKSLDKKINKRKHKMKKRKWAPNKSKNNGGDSKWRWEHTEIETNDTRIKLPSLPTNGFSKVWVKKREEERGGEIYEAPLVD